MNKYLLIAALVLGLSLSGTSAFAGSSCCKSAKCSCNMSGCTQEGKCACGASCCKDCGCRK